MERYQKIRQILLMTPEEIERIIKERRKNLYQFKNVADILMQRRNDNEV